MKDAKGHLLAFVTIVIWGTTFVSTKILLAQFTPVEILFLRFFVAFFALLAICPRRMKGTTLQMEITFAAAGLCGICLYYLLENIALTYTLASNVGVLVSTAPFFTAILSRIFFKEEKLRANFFAGFAVSMVGIFLVNFNGAKLELNPTGDLLALLASFVWACYSLLVKKIGGYEGNAILATRRIFFYGILFMIPALFFFDFRLDFEPLKNPLFLSNILYLALGASAICFVTWNMAVKILGAVKTSVYIYIVPVVTIGTSAVVLRERPTVCLVVGTLFVTAGLFLSEGKNMQIMDNAN